MARAGRAIPTWLAILVIVAAVAAVVRNQIRVYQGRRARADVVHHREALFRALQPVVLSNCSLERFGEPNDGGYLMCANLLGAVEAGYSYGISGYDKWGCDVSTRLRTTVHQYDCFDPTRPACPQGETIFHEECVGDAAAIADGRAFDTIPNQLAKNGDRSKRIVLKMDVEGAEWSSLLSAPDDMLTRIDQMIVEFHWLRTDTSQWRDDERYLRLLQRLKRFFEIVHVHFNNAGCVDGLEPFTTWAYEVLFVNRRLAVIDQSRVAAGLHPFDAPNNPSLPDCQPAGVLK